MQNSVLSPTPVEHGFRDTLVMVILIGVLGWLQSGAVEYILELTRQNSISQWAFSFIAGWCLLMVIAFLAYNFLSDDFPAYVRNNIRGHYLVVTLTEQGEVIKEVVARTKVYLAIPRGAIVLKAGGWFIEKPYGDGFVCGKLNRRLGGVKIRRVSSVYDVNGANIIVEICDSFGNRLKLPLNQVARKILAISPTEAGNPDSLQPLNLVKAFCPE